MKLRKSGLVRELEGKWHVAKCSYCECLCRELSGVENE